VFIAEAYNPKVYQQYLTQGKFDYLYDKVGLYDAVKRLIKNDSLANTADIVNLAIADSTISNNLLRFLENHDEERIASKGFAQKGENGIPGMIVSATLSGGPAMIYFGQEVGERGDGKEGFGGEDNRTTLFDYWGVPAHQAWMNNGAFDGKGLSEDQKKLRAFYVTLLNYCKNSDAIKFGKLTMLTNEGLDKKSIAYVRSMGDKIVLIVVNFNRDKTVNLNALLPANLLDKKKGKTVTLNEILTQQNVEINDLSKGIPVQVSPMNGVIFEVE
jgi:glycosidase